jgi:hypothetical protein
MSTRPALLNRREHITQNIEIGGQRILYFSVHNDERLPEIFLVKGRDYSSELMRLYKVIARLLSISVQDGAPHEKLGDLLAGANSEPCGPVSVHNRLKHCTSLPDLIGRDLLIEYCDQED